MEGDFQTIRAGISLITYNGKGERVNNDGLISVDNSSGYFDLLGEGDGCLTCAQWDEYKFNGVGIFADSGKDWDLYKMGFKVGPNTKKLNYL